ncbi:condensation domain-containing protein [Streptomyces anulatus]|uniref:condensation domain-containing protein n=1 Tax=Streptomyces anulatus TaxID=1892 RepID=UPI00225B2AAE|nr:condensation domain-containing protein [Streptomyces anulatus]MCX4504978.1 condensation domain-containing protein [Streptomyces anulatus]WTD09525.1 condensation domain-containing protein [Streptomyces anulatus]WTE02833.1 condensation domain-containing protein [Streptomyces anulatus]
MNSAAGKDTMHGNPPHTTTVTVAYAGGDERRGPLTMGQANMIRCILRDDPTHINIHDVWPVPGGTAPEAVRDALRALAVRHEGLRTTFPRPQGVTPVDQVVSAEGTFTVTVLDHAELPADPAGYAESVARAARAGRFDLEREFPLRITLLTVAGEPVHVALAFSHAVADGSAMAILREEFAELLAGKELSGLASLPPVDLAAVEASPAGLRKSEASLRYWERILRTGPQEMFAEPRGRRPGTDEEARQLTLRSRRGSRALAAAARRTGHPEATVLMAAWCALVAHRAGQDSCVTAVPSANRFHARVARSVTTTSQDALLHLDVRVPAFDALVARTWGAVLNAYRHSQFDSVRLWEMIDRVTTERGSHFGRDVVFNDVSALPAPLLGADTQERDDAEQELTWGPPQALPTRLLAFTYRTAPQLHISLWAAPSLFTPEEAKGFLSGLVLLLEAAAAGDMPMEELAEVTGVRPAERGPGWLRVDGCWVSPDAVREALGRAVDGLPVRVAKEPGPDGTADGTAEGATGTEPHLTAYLARGDTSLTPEAAHRALTALIPAAGSGVLAPQRYVLVENPPTEPDRTDAWRRLKIIEEGTGRSRQVRHER